jgi:hypothetical protein
MYKLWYFCNEERLYDHFSSFAFSYSQAVGRMFSQYSGGGKEQTLGQEYTQEILNDQVMCLVAHKNNWFQGYPSTLISSPPVTSIATSWTRLKLFGKTMQGLEKNKHSTRDATSRIDAVRTEQCGSYASRNNFKTWALSSNIIFSLLSRLGIDQ